MTEKVKFFGSSCDVCVTLEEGRTSPSIRQRLLIYRLQRYAPELMEKICDAAERHRFEYEGPVGFLHEEYGLPIMNRKNIREHFSYGLILIPRLTGSSDDYTVLGCDCEWDIEHGMEMLIKNGTEVPWQGVAGPWHYKTPHEFMKEGNAQ